MRRYSLANFKRIYREYLNTVKGDIEVEMRSQNRIATGNAIRSLRVVANQHLEAEVRGVKYIDYLVDGQGSHPSKFGRGLIANIAQWMQAKGISPRRKGEVVPSTATNIRRSAGAIARSIWRNGTAIAQGETGLHIQEALEENKPDLLKEMGLEMRQEFKDIMKLKRK